MGQVAVCFASEWPAAKEELISADTKGPPVDSICVTTLREDLRCHIGHASCHTGEQATIGIVDSDIEIGEVGMATLVKENVVGLEISEGECRRRTKVGEKGRRTDA